MSLRMRLLRVLFPCEHNELLTTRHDLADINRRYGSMVGSLMRTPQPDTPWMDKFLALEKEFVALESDLSEARVAEFYARKDVSRLLQLVPVGATVDYGALHQLLSDCFHKLRLYHAIQLEESLAGGVEYHELQQRIARAIEINGA
jgi:hypothetical protein